MAKAKIEITGILPLLLHSDRGCNPSDPLVRELKKYTGKRSKTDEDLEMIARIEYELALPVNSKGVPAIHSKQIKASLRDGGKKSKLGKLITEAVFVLGDNVGYVPLVYTGPNTVDKLFADKTFVDMRTVVVQGRRIMRCRPIFNEWGLKFDIDYDHELIDQDVLFGVFETSGARVGIGDYRPEYGRYSVTCKAI